MEVNGTLINYYFHCKRQCWLHANRINLENEDETVKIGKALHEEKLGKKENTEVKIDNIAIDKITKDYLVEIKKSDADFKASKWQLLLYLSVLKKKGIHKKGKLVFIEKNKTDKKTYYFELTEDNENDLKKIIFDIKELIANEKIPNVDFKNKCKKCSYYQYCMI
ncbi:CRISPR-associated protein Cas4 [Geotoga petraea]|jgi:CRISPR-associated exonuclease Cas4|uniref:CRISPR-associated exonuclease Cas4 n=1 Tax=Geotoga petraea TaxID=28234 RepID=A0A1G6HPT6_9BACT|nr:CRISPR-associated protein Cas4 [Geotoga petraea]TGG88909.1 CRISPR-associated protein Cas4 [Geotoga petraea]SDB96211.1 CRISPR-associated exonuclease, Cas4 family [Geotoga petraea]